MECKMMEDRAKKDQPTGVESSEKSGTRLLVLLVAIPSSYYGILMNGLIHPSHTHW